MLDLLMRLLVGFLPVTLFLAALIYLDSYKLVPLRTVLTMIAVGGIAAGASYFINTAVLERVAMEMQTYSRYVAPVVEEILKGLAIVFVMRTNRIGFLVDAAILGFALGTGFALIENLYYLTLLHDAHFAVWIIRGFGTAIMHGGATAIFAMISMALAERRQSKGLTVFLPGLLIAIVIHSLYNHFLLSPVLSAVAVLLLLPPLIQMVFQRSEKALEDWLDVGIETDTELLELIHSGQFTESKVGQYLTTLREHFSGPVVVDLLCYLRLHTELSMRAKGELMMRESGFQTEIAPDVKSKLEELKYLEKSIGKTGKYAILPFLRVSDKDLWQIYMLEKKA